MELNSFQEEMRHFLPEIELRFEEPMSRHTSLRIGGPAEVMAFPKTAQELAQILQVSKNLDIKCAILGAGTNILAPDAGCRGLVICLKDCLGGMELLPENCIRVMAGVTMARAAVFAANHGLAGLEFAHGIPGTVGGGVYMNAGAYGGEIGRTVSSIRYLDKEGIHEIGPEEAGFEYRSSRFMRENAIVLGAEMTLQPGDRQAIMDRMQELAEQRKSKQPLEYPSAGSMFKRPEGFFAGKLIQDAGLAGYSVGGAQVSEKHCGFVINRGNATAEDVRELVRQVADRVEQTFGVRLEPEVRYLSQEGLKPLLA